MKTKTIVMPVYRRPAYTKQALDALATCDGIDDYVIIFSIDGNSCEVREVIEEFCLHDKVYFQGPNKGHEGNDRYGANANVLQALNLGFELTDFVILVEDDVILSPDALKFLQWGNREFGSNSTITAISAYNRNNKEFDDVNRAVMKKGFCPWGIGIWKNRFTNIEFDCDSLIAWDTQIKNQTKGKYIVQPLVGRCQNIGAENGAYVSSSTWHSKNIYSPYWIMNNSARQNSYNYYLDDMHKYYLDKLCQEQINAPKTFFSPPP